MTRGNMALRAETIDAELWNPLEGHWTDDIWDSRHEMFDPWRTRETERKTWPIYFNVFPFGIGREIKLCYKTKLETDEWTYRTLFHYGRLHQQLSSFLTLNFPNCHSLIQLPDDVVTRYESFLVQQDVKHADSYTTPLGQIFKFVKDLYKYQRSYGEVQLDELSIPKSKLSQLATELAGYWGQDEWNVYDPLFDVWRNDEKVKGAGILRFAALPEGIKQELQLFYKIQLKTGEFTIHRVVFLATTHPQLVRFLRLQYPGCVSLTQLPVVSGKEYEEYLRNAGLRAASKSYTPLLNMARDFLMDYYEEPIIHPSTPISQPNQEMLRDLKESLEGYWGEDIWNASNATFNPWREENWPDRTKLIHFAGLPDGFKDEMKFYCKSRIETLGLKLQTVFLHGASFRRMGAFLRYKYPMLQSFSQLPDGFLMDYEEYLQQRGHDPQRYFLTPINQANLFFLDFYDSRDEFEKDVWDTKKIPGARHSPHRVESTRIDFTKIPVPFRPVVKRYAKVMLVNVSVAQVGKEVLILRKFLNHIHESHPEWITLHDLSREDMENYYVWLRNDSKEKVERHYIQQLIYLRKFLEYVQNAAYPEAPSRLISGLMFAEDIPHRNVASEENIKYIPEEVLVQLEDHLMDLDRLQYIPVVILLRATGWRASDILNLRYDKCLDKKAEGWYICGDINKTKVLNHRVPITEDVATIVKLAAEDAKEKSTPENNPEKFLFVNYRGKRMGIPYQPSKIAGSLNRLAAEKQIVDSNGEIFHFRNHAFRHTKAVELINNGMSLLLVQKWLAHASANMTQTYAKILDSTMRKSWEEISKAGVFRLKESGYFTEVDREEPQSEDKLEWEYVRSNLDAVRQPLGYCMKPIKLECKHQLSPCLTCHNLATTPDFLPQFQEERNEVLNMIERGKQLGRKVWVEKNEALLGRYDTIIKILEQGKVHHPAGKRRRETSECGEAKS